MILKGVVRQRLTKNDALRAEPEIETPVTASAARQSAVPRGPKDRLATLACSAPVRRTEFYERGGGRMATGSPRLTAANSSGAKPGGTPMQPCVADPARTWLAWIATPSGVRRSM